LRPSVTKICRHEAGHLVVAKTFGFRTGDVSIELLDGQGGHLAASEIILATALATIADVATYLRNRTVVIYPGALAESMNDGVISNEEAVLCMRKGAAIDHGKARELIHVIRSIEHGVPASSEENQLQLSALDVELWNTAVETVVRERVCIEAVSDRLAAKVKSMKQKYYLAEDEIERIPELAKRFGRLVNPDLST
jgi:hypothetical protein